MMQSTEKSKRKSVSEIWKKEKRFKKQTWLSKIPHTYDRIISKKYSFMFMWQSYEMWIYIGTPNDRISSKHGEVEI